MPRHIGADLLAALAVTTIAVPQGMAYALLTGVPAHYGLWAAALAPIVYAAFGSSSHLAVGPVATTSLLVAGSLEGLAIPQSPHYIELVATMAAMVGVGFLILGALRAGVLVNFLSHPAFVGFTAATALLTALSQIRPLLGIPGHLLAGTSALDPWPVLTHLHHLHPLSAAIGLGALALLLLVPRVLPRTPAALLACVCGGLLVWLLSWDDLGVAVVGNVPRTPPRPALPVLDGARLLELLGPAASVAVLAYGSSIAVAKAIAAKVRERISPDRELFGLGAANIASALVSGFPVSASLGRSKVAHRSGGRTRLAGLFCGLIVIATIVGLAPVFAWLPIPVTAAIIVHAALQLFDIADIRDVFRTRTSDAATLAVTFVATLTIGMVEGLAVGLVIAMVLFVVRTASPHTSELGRVPGTMVWQDVTRSEVETCPQAGILRVDAPLYYANARHLEDAIAAMFVDRPEMRIVVLECSGASDLDATAVQALRNAFETLRGRGNDLHLVGAIPPVRRILDRSGLAAALGPGRLHRTLAEAAPVIMNEVSREYCEQRCSVSAFPDCTLIPRARLTTPRSEAARFSPQI